LIEKDCSLDIFEQTTNTNELVKEFVGRELHIFKRYQVDINAIKCPLWWWEKHESMFPTVDFLTCKILSIIELQIETKRILSFDGILTN